MVATNAQQIKDTVNCISNQTSAPRVSLMTALSITLGLRKIVDANNPTRMNLLLILQVVIGLTGYGFKHLCEAFVSKVTKDKIGFSRSTMYNALQDKRINWLGIMSAICLTVAKRTLKKRPWQLVVDDTLILRNSSKHVELLAKVYDHNRKTYHKGFTVLTVAATDGKNTVPLAFALLSSSRDRNCLNKGKKAIKGSSRAGKKRTQARMPKMNVLLSMLKDIQKMGISVEAVLMDSWFSSPSQVRRVHALGFDVVTMLRIGKTKYKTKSGKTFNTAEIAEQIRNSKTSAGIAKSILVDLGDGLVGKLIFVRNWCNDSAKRRPYIPLLCTKSSWSDKKIRAMYKRRWSIEVLYRNLKGLFGLQSGNQAQNFEANIALLCIAHIRYAVAIFAKSELFPKESLEKVCSMLTLEAVYSEPFEEHLTTLKNLAKLKNQLQAEIEINVLSTPGALSSPCQTVMLILNYIGIRLDDLIQHSVEDMSPCSQEMLFNRVKHGNIIGQISFLKSTNGVNMPFV